MKRSGFKRPQFERQPSAPLVPLARLPNDGPSTRAEPVPKGVKAKPGKRAPTADEALWMGAIVAYGCIACHVDRLSFAPTRPPAVHHILRGGRRIGHRFTLPLCDPGHHQGGAQFGVVSRHPWKPKFEAIYGTEDELLRRLCAALGWEYPG